jgi:hypothetical protein
MHQELLKHLKSYLKSIKSKHKTLSHKINNDSGYSESYIKTLKIKRDKSKSKATELKKLIKEAEDRFSISTPKLSYVTYCKTVPTFPDFIANYTPHKNFHFLPTYMQKMLLQKQELALAEKKKDKIFTSMRTELNEAISKFPTPFNSSHEGFAVLKEEVDELWDEIKNDKSPGSKERQIEEAIQIGAMAAKFILQLSKE